MAGSFLIACLGSLRLVSTGYFALDIQSVIYRLQVPPRPYPDLAPIHLLHRDGPLLVQLDLQRLLRLFRPEPGLNRPIHPRRLPRLPVARELPVAAAGGCWGPTGYLLPGECVYLCDALYLVQEEAL